MQLIAEAYDILKRGLGLEEKEIAEIFAKVSDSRLSSSHSSLLIRSGKRASSVEGVNGGPLSGSLLSSSVEDLLDHGDTVSVVELEDVSGSVRPSLPDASLPSRRSEFELPRSSPDLPESPSKAAVDLGGLSHEHESLSVRDDLGSVKGLLEVVDKLLLVALEGLSGSH
jgi:hypothetical protein